MDLETQDVTLRLQSSQALAGSSTTPIDINRSMDTMSNDSEASDGETTPRVTSCKWASMMSSYCSTYSVQSASYLRTAC